MSAKFLTVAFISCLLLVQGSSATGVGVGFTIDNGLSQTGIFDVYDADTDVWLNDETFADGFTASMSDIREMGGAGDMIATQTYAGGQSVRGFSSVKARDADIRVTSQAGLFPGGVMADVDGWISGENVDLSVKSASGGDGESDRVSGDSIDFKGTLSASLDSASAIINTGSSDLRTRSKTFEKRNSYGHAVVSIDVTGGTYSLERLPTKGFGELFNMDFKARGSNINLNIAAENKGGQYAFANAWADSGSMEAHPAAWVTDTSADVWI
ncbi:MAG TPA: hypothetical protein VLB04_13035 [Methanotrichaceae archaeon]|nr:hypothetical protein [Methanotrichaceae archaeon]